MLSDEGKVNFLNKKPGNLALLDLFVKNNG